MALAVITGMGFALTRPDGLLQILVGSLTCWPRRRRVMTCSGGVGTDVLHGGQFLIMNIEADLAAGFGS